MYNMDGEFYAHGTMELEGGHAMNAVGFNDGFTTQAGYKGGMHHVVLFSNIKASLSATVGTIRFTAPTPVAVVLVVPTQLATGCKKSVSGMKLLFVLILLILKIGVQHIYCS